MNSHCARHGNGQPHNDKTSAAAEYDELLWKFRAVFWEADPLTWEFHYVSEYAELLFGYPRRRWLEEKDFWIRILHPQDRDYAVNYCREATLRGQDHCFDYRILAADGRVVWVRDIVRVECDGFNRQPKRLYGIMVDITEQKELELRHQADQQKLRSLLEQIPAVIWTVDRELRFSSSQGRGLARLHLQEDQVAGRTLYEYFATADEDFLPIAMHRRALAGESVHYDLVWQGRFFRTFLQPWREGEQIAGVLGLALDFTEQHAETELLRQKLAAEKRIISLVKRSERLLRAVASLNTPQERVHFAVQKLVETFDCAAAAVLARSLGGKILTLAQAGVNVEWQDYVGYLGPRRRRMFFALPISDNASKSRLIFLFIRRNQETSWWLGVIHPDWERQLHPCTLRLLRMLADFLALCVENLSPALLSEDVREKRYQDDIAQQEQSE